MLHRMRVNRHFDRFSEANPLVARTVNAVSSSIEEKADKRNAH